MTQELWTAVDRYVCDRLLADDPTLDAALAASDAAGLPPIAVTPAQGKLLELLVRIHGASRILELGTLGGYSTIWLARGLPPGGSLVTLELDPHHAEVATANLDARAWRRWCSCAWASHCRRWPNCTPRARSRSTDLHRRGQAQLPRVSGMVAEALSSREA